MWWDSTGRFRLSGSRDDVLHLGYRYVTINFDTDSPLLPDHLDELSLAAGIPIHENTWLILGAGYSGNNPFAAPGMTCKANAVHIHVMVEAAMESGIGLGWIIPILP